MTVDELRKRLEGIRGDLLVLVRAENEDCVLICETPHSAYETYGCGDEEDDLFFAIDVMEEEQDG